MLVLLTTFTSVIAISCGTPKFSDLVVNMQCDSAERAYRFARIFKTSRPFLSVDDICIFKSISHNIGNIFPYILLCFHKSCWIGAGYKLQQINESINQRRREPSQVGNKHVGMCKCFPKEDDLGEMAIFARKAARL